MAYPFVKGELKLHPGYAAFFFRSSTELGHSSFRIRRNHRRSTMFDCLFFITHVTLICSAIKLSSHGQSESPRLLARLTIPTSSFAPLENFPISIKISNPTSRTVELRGPEIGICHPSILRHAEGAWTPLRCVDQGSSSSLVIVALSPGETKRVDRFLYYQFDLDRWPQSAGNYLIRLNLSEYVGRYARPKSSVK